MNASIRDRVLSTLRTLLVLCAVPAMLGACSDPGPAPPSVDPGSLELSLANRLRELTAAVEAEPLSAAAWGRLGAAYDVHELYNEAIPCYERAAELDNADFRWPYYLGICKQLGDRAAAMKHFEDASKLEPEHAPLLYLLGNGHLQTGDLARAEESFERALEVEPRLIVGHLGLAKVALAREDGAAALEHLSTARGIGPKTNEIQGLLEQAYRLTGDDAKADEQAELVVGMTRLEPITDPLRFNLRLAEGVTVARRREKSDHLLEHGDREGALAIWDEAIAEDPGSYDVHLQAGHVKSKAGRFDLAVESYRNAIELDDTAEAHLGLGNALYQMRDADAAVPELRRALEIDPNLHEARLNLGFMLMGRGETVEGLNLIETACAGLPNEPDAHFNLAQAYRNEGRTDDAMKEYEIVVSIDKHHFRGCMAYGAMLAEAGRFDEAAVQFEEATHARSRIPQPYDSWSQMLHKAGRHAEERAALESALARMPGNPILRRRMGWILATCPDDSVRDGARAVELALELCEETQFTAPSALHVLAVAYAEAGDFDKGAQRAREAIELLDAKEQLTAREAAHRGELTELLATFAASKPYRAREV